MKILYAASEAAPFAKSGGLADVAGALPKALVRDGIDCRVVLPLYNDLKFKDTLTYVTNFSVPVGWRSQYCGLFRAERDGVTFYFLDNEYYFKRSGLYGFYDDGERFAFFARAILEMLFYTDFEPDIINCNDWETALTPVYLNLYYRHLDKFNRIKTVFTIHNIAYQGKYGLDILEDTCGIGKRDAHVVEYDGCANFMKWTASVWNRTPAWRQTAPISAMGWMVPISLLANMTLTRQVSGRMALRTCSAVTTPSGGMSSRVTSYPSRSRAWRVWSTAWCSNFVEMMWRLPRFSPRAAAVRRAWLSASLPPEVKVISRGSACRFRAKMARASASFSAARCPGV